MTAVTEVFRKIGVYGDLKHILIQCGSDTDDNWTIDLHSDISDGRGAAMNTILNTLHQDDAGADVTASWVPGTGVITLGGTMTEGIHNISVWGF